MALLLGIGTYHLRAIIMSAPDKWRGPANLYSTKVLCCVSDEFMSEARIKKWFRIFKSGRTSGECDPRCGVI